LFVKLVSALRCARIIVEKISGLLLTLRFENRYHQSESVMVCGSHLQNRATRLRVNQKDIEMGLRNSAVG